MTDTCFLICPIGANDSDIRRRSDQWVRHVVRPVMDELGYEVVRADEMPNTGIITNQVIRAIIESPLVIADLTGRNPNVFYELALRHACRKPYIQMVNAGEKIPFDLQSVRTIEYDLSDPDHLKTASTTLSRHIHSIRQGHQVDSPVSMAIAESLFSDDNNALPVFLEKFWQMESDTEKVLTGIDELKDSLNSIESSVSSLESDVSSIEGVVQKSEPSHLSKDIWQINRSLDLLQTEMQSIKGLLKKSES